MGGTDLEAREMGSGLTLNPYLALLGKIILPLWVFVSLMEKIRVLIFKFWWLYIYFYGYLLGNPGGSVGKESTCNAEVSGAKGSIPGSGRSPGGGHGNPLQYPCLENPMNRGAWQATVHGIAKSDMTEVTEHAHTWLFIYKRNILPVSQIWQKKTSKYYGLCCRKSSWVDPCDWWII